jgi:hypothetical protein
MLRTGSLGEFREYWTLAGESGLKQQKCEESNL